MFHDILIKRKEIWFCLKSAYLPKMPKNSKLLLKIQKNPI